MVCCPETSAFFLSLNKQTAWPHVFCSLFSCLQGKGIVHAEMPCGPERGHGLQLWVNLKSADKMVAPAYQVMIRLCDER